METLLGTFIDYCAQSMLSVSVILCCLVVKSITFTQQLRGQRIIVAADAWPRYSRYPTGHFVRSLGPIGDKATENEVLLLEHDIPHSTFSEAVLDCLPELPWIITPQGTGCLKQNEIFKIALKVTKIN